MSVAWLTPTRRRGREILDDPATPDDVRARAMRDIARSNRLFGGTRAVVRAIAPLLREAPSAVVLDVGTGTGDIAAAVAARHPRAYVIGLDMADALLRDARPRLHAMAAGSALALPLRDDSVDLVICSQLLHHFEEADALRVLRELHRVSRGWILVSDLRRSWAAAAGFGAASTMLGFHPVTQHDGVVSVLRGFTAAELRALVRAANGREPQVRRGLFWRLTALWTKAADAVAAYT